MPIYVLKDGINGKIIEAFDTQTSAETQKDNLIKTGQYRRIIIEIVNVSSATVAPLSVVRVEGKMTPAGPKFDVIAYDPSTPVSDTLTFAVSSRQITFEAYINLTAAEISAPNISALTTRISAYIEQEFATRIENDN